MFDELPYDTLGQIKAEPKPQPSCICKDGACKCADCPDPSKAKLDENNFPLGYGWI